MAKKRRRKTLGEAAREREADMAEAEFTQALRRAPRRRRKKRKKKRAKR